MKRIKWDKKKAAKCVEILKEHRDLNEALNEISSSLVKTVSVDSLDTALKRYGFATSRSYLLPNPVEQFEKKKEDSVKDRKIRELTEKVIEFRSRQTVLDALEASKRTEVFSSPVHGKREMCAVVLASDWHVEEQVRPESVAYRNEYDMAIANGRIQRFFDAIIWNVRHQRASGLVDIHDMVLWLGGDLMSGYIHEELLESNAMSPTETIIWLMPKLEAGIRLLMTELELQSLVIPCSFGNHGRTTQKPRVSTAYANSYEYLMYRQLATRFAGLPNVKFEITPSAHQYIEVYGFTIHFHHGDDVRYQGGVGGLAIPLLKAVPMWDMVKKSDLHCIGHHHTLRDFGNAIVNGSMIGYGAYSQRIRAPYEPPGQMMFYMDSKRGKSMVTHLWLD